jgi:hypothetical protein
MSPLPQIILIPIPVASNGWLTGPRRLICPPHPSNKRPPHWPPRQMIPSPPARDALEQVRRELAERRAAKLLREP